MRIGELSERCRVPASTIRYWERLGILPKPARSAGQRQYGADAVYRVALVLLAQECGFSLDATKRLIHGFGPGVPASRRWLQLARTRQTELEQQMDRLRAMRQVLERVMDCRCADLSECGRIAGTALRLPRDNQAKLDPSRPA
jgi:MerR family transcriptional regulator, redox-sensitive transcriptional activator SoxR